MAPLHNNQRDGFMRQTINRGRVALPAEHARRRLPVQARRRAGGFVTYPEAIDGPKVRARGEKFFDHFSQATLFWNSQSEPEKQHIVQALRFELGKVDDAAIRERMVGLLAQVDRGARDPGGGRARASRCPAKPDGPLNHSVPADGDPEDFQPIPCRARSRPSRPRSAWPDTARTRSKTRKVAILAADGVDEAAVAAMSAPRPTRAPCRRSSRPAAAR